MPEGDTIFRTARALGRALAGKPVTNFRSTFPLLTRFDDETPVAGQTVDTVESRGKWLLIHFSGGGTLATHMLMNGSWHIYRPGEHWQQSPRNMRIVVENRDYLAVGFSVPVAKIFGPEQLVRATRIPAPAIDVLSNDFDASEVMHRLLIYRDEEIADVLLHQEVMAGVGNEFKSEICFVLGVNPFLKVKDLRAGEIEALIAASVRLVKANVLEDSGDTRMTYNGMHRRTTGRIDPRERVWVYGRGGEPCRKCDEPILRRLQGPDARVTFWCPGCQRDRGQ